MADETTNQDTPAVADGAMTTADVATPAAPDAPAEDSKVVETPVEAPAVDPSQPAGVPEGTVEKTDPNTPEAVAERIEHAEKVVHETDENGNVVGWHKEAVNG